MNRILLITAVACLGAILTEPTVVRAAACQVAGPVAAGHVGVSAGCGGGGGGGVNPVPPPVTPPPSPPVTPPPAGSPAQPDVVSQMAAMGYPTGYVQTTSSLPAVANYGWGTTPAQWKANLAQVVYYNFYYNPNLDLMFTNMPDVALARLSTELAFNDTGGWTYYILQIAAERLGVANCKRLIRAFGIFGAQGTQQVWPYIPAAVSGSCLNTSLGAAIGASHYWASQGQGTVGQTDPAYDVYLDVITQGNGDPSAAEVRASQFVFGATGIRPIWLEIKESPILVAIAIAIAAEACSETRCLEAGANWLSSYLQGNGQTFPINWYPTMFPTPQVPNIAQPTPPCFDCYFQNTLPEDDDQSDGGVWKVF
jgi:hypothetical protein